MKEEHKPTKRVLDILDILATTTKGMTLTEISKAIDSPKSTLHPIVQTMVQNKYIFFDENTYKYFIGIKTFCIGSSYTNNLDLLDIIKKEMKYIVEKTNEICQLGILNKDKVLYIAKVDSERAIRIISNVGKELPAYCTALGKALLCNENIDSLKELYPEGLKKYTENTILNFEKLYEELQKIQKESIAFEFSEIMEDLVCVATPLKIEDNHIVAAISISIPSFRINDKKLIEIKDILLQSKEKIEAILKLNPHHHIQLF
ncbi:MAG: IclR family transcriptional regulator [Fusobacterium mortiferum]|jgi:IclR family KDG regulon transcriptional repressor|uniref:IclR family transcriptional regulator n=1 Tax=Fusobacterium mortiferum TaxID=850 RepID=UPI000E53C763|nr:IclR family transcriptional regulator [Fusobacterium mortiferum]MCF2628568.1 IclR family transcriptional regulator [Fusobacterium mortiferum]MDD7262218.1 IclR family transcriptional regulator [Fusobacterium mortiferum]MDY4801960.1 IclR family transcriptional regulator [Fusobacterium mortiferum]MDY5980929.1 IclR family transcriptional regulator [Fusobacterium mortiferum]RHF69364.1 IclR family transcriptional regulator [Fusobacterium mortiferum]